MRALIKRAGSHLRPSPPARDTGRFAAAPVDRTGLWRAISRDRKFQNLDIRGSTKGSIAAGLLQCEPGSV